MKKTKGIVMRTSVKLTVIFTDQGDFLEIPTPKDPPQLGETIEVTIKPPRMLSFRNSWLKYSTAAVLLLALSLTAFYLFLIPNVAVASVSLDINQGVELLVNNRGRVIKVRDVNGASGILAGISIQGLDVYQTVNLILENANNRGMFTETQNLVLASVVPIHPWGKQMIDTEVLRNSIRDDMLLLNLSGNVVVGQTTPEIRRAAQQQEMSVNSYLVYDRCEEYGITVQPDSIRNNLQKALTDANVSIAGLFPQESLAVGAENRDHSEDTRQRPGDSKTSEHTPSASMKSAPQENHFNDDNSEEQHRSSGSSGATEPLREPAHESPSESSHDDSSKAGSSQAQPANSAGNNTGIDHETSSPETEYEASIPINDPENSKEHTEGEHTESGHMENESYSP